jgi:hypothetical protein
VAHTHALRWWPLLSHSACRLRALSLRALSRRAFLLRALWLSTCDSTCAFRGGLRAPLPPWIWHRKEPLCMVKSSPFSSAAFCGMYLPRRGCPRRTRAALRARLCAHLPSWQAASLIACVLLARMWALQGVSCGKDACWMLLVNAAGRAVVRVGARGKVEHGCCCAHLLSSCSATMSSE